MLYFKAATEGLGEAPPRDETLRLSLREEILSVCATKVLDIRPGRQEPRAIKRRPKPFQLLTAPRHVFQEIPHKENYRKAA